MPNDTRLKNEQARFVEWLKLGTEDARVAVGQPPNILQYSKQFKIARATLHRWKSDPEVKRAVARQGINMFSVDEIKQARDTLVERALGGNVQAIKLILDLSGVSHEQEVNAPKVDLSKVVAMSDADLQAALDAAEDDESGFLTDEDFVD